MRGPWRRARVDVSFPVGNIGDNLPTLAATVAGNLYDLGETTGVRLLSLDLPRSYRARFERPRQGIAGTRRLASVPDRPLLGTIIKPNLGLSAEQTGTLVGELCEAGIDFIKDDEVCANPVHAPLAERVKAVMARVRQFQDRAGRRVMVAFNITDDIDAMRRHAELVEREGGSCVMASLNWCGFSAMTALRRSTGLAIHGHRNGFGAFSRHPALGIAFDAYQALWRLTGIDHMHVHGLDGKFADANDEVAAAARACLAPMADNDGVMPVLLFRAVGWDVADDLRCAEKPGHDLSRRRRDPGASRRTERRSRQHAAGLGRGAVGDEPGRFRAQGAGSATGARVLRAQVGRRIVPPRIGYYGDDFTGATDTLMTATRAGLRTVLFLGVPTQAQLEAAGPLDCLGIAGVARSMTNAEMETELAPVGAFFAESGVPVVHYKTCSTFDSSPAIGSIGVAVSVLRRFVEEPVRPDRRRAAEPEPLLPVRQSVRGGGDQRTGPPHRPAPDDEPASGDADGRGRPAPAFRAAGPRAYPVGRLHACMRRNRMRWTRMSTGCWPSGPTLSCSTSARCRISRRSGASSGSARSGSPCSRWGRAAWSRPSRSSGGRRMRRRRRRSCRASHPRPIRSSSWRAASRR